MALLNRCGFRAQSSGSGHFVVGAALPNFYLPAQAQNPSIVDGETYRYLAISDDGAEHEEANGTWVAASSTLQRTTIHSSSNAGNAVNFTAAPKIVFTDGAQDHKLGSDFISDLSTSGTGDTVLKQLEPLITSPSFSGPASRFLFGDDEVGLQVELAAIGTGNNPAKIEIDADGNLNLVNTPGAQVGIRDANEGFVARFSTGNLTDNRSFTFQDLNGDLLVSGGFADFTNVLLDHNPTDNTPALNLQAFWNDGGVAFRGLFIDINDTASDPASRAFGIDIDGVEVFTVRESEMYVLGDLSSDGSVFAADVQSDSFVQGTEYRVSTIKVVGAQGASVADAAGGATVDAEARTAINALLARVRAHGLIAT